MVEMDVCILATQTLAHGQPLIFSHVLGSSHLCCVGAGLPTLPGDEKSEEVYEALTTCQAAAAGMNWLSVHANNIMYICWRVAGVAQHAQGDLDAALQTFERASQLAQQALADSSSDAMGSSGEQAALHSGPDEPQEHDTGTARRASIERARRTQVKALMSQASILKRLGRPKEALVVAQQAAVLDEVVQVHVQQLNQELATPKGCS